jgi:hypothetical protein
MPRNFTLRAWRWWLLCALVVLAVATELFARFYLGLGAPPLYQTHPTIEYLFKPNQHLYRFGNLFISNRYGMRSDDFPPQKVRPNELRVIVYGDSVINGGSLTDHAFLGTTLLQEKLTKLLQRPVVVGNVSAGSWGPPNELAYLKQFGLLGADVVILELSSEDFVDSPTFEPLDPLTHPTETPWSAAWEGLTRYLPSYLESRQPAAPFVPAGGNPADPINPRDEKECLDAERDFLRIAADAGVPAVVLQHWRESELRRGQPDPGHAEILRTATEERAAVYQDVDVFRKHIQAGHNPYRDDIHPNVEGQQALAEIYFDIVEHALSPGVLETTSPDPTSGRGRR